MPRSKPFLCPPGLRDLRAAWNGAKLASFLRASRLMRRFRSPTEISSYGNHCHVWIWIAKSGYKSLYPNICNAPHFKLGVATVEDHMWYCAVCQIPNAPNLTACRNCKTSRELTTEKLQEKNDVVESRLIYVFQALFVLIGFFVSRAGHVGLLASVIIILFAWWFGIALFASQPIGGEFRRERRFVERVIADAQSQGIRQLINACFRVLYWPIFVSKNVYTALIVGAVVIYLAVGLVRD